MTAERDPRDRVDPEAAGEPGAPAVPARAEDTPGVGEPPEAKDRDAPAAPPDLPERAIIYVPPLGHTDGRSIGDLGTRLAAYLDQDDRVRSVTYAVGETAHTVRFGRTSPKTSAAAVTIVRKASAKETSLGIYEFSYSSSFLERFDEKSSWKKAFGLIVTVASSLSLLAASFTRGRRPAAAKWLRRWVYANVALVAGAVVYAIADPDPDTLAAPAAVGVGVLLSAGGCLEGARRLRRSENDAAGALPRPLAVAASAAVALGGLIMSWEYSASLRARRLAEIVLVLGVVLLLFVWLKLGNPDLDQRLQVAGGFLVVAVMGVYAVALVAAALGLSWGVVNGAGKDTVEGLVDPWAGYTVALAAVGVTFSPKALRSTLNHGLTYLVGAVRYLAHADGRDAQRGRLYELVEHLAELGYKSIDIVGYSFGSVLALDALYRRDPENVPGGTRQCVKRLVTIGCPVVTVGTFWPDYWKGRVSWGGKWVNVYSPLDVLSSNLCSPPATAAAETWVDPGRRGASSLRPTQERSYNHTDSATTQLNARDKLLAGGLRAHGQYWEDKYAHDPGAVAVIADLWAGANWSGGPLQPDPGCSSG